MLADVEGCIETDGTELPRPAVLEIMEKWVDLGPCDIRVLLEIPGRVEKRVGVPVLGGSVVQVMLQGIELCGTDIRIAANIPIAIEEPAEIIAQGVDRTRGGLLTKLCSDLMVLK